jgi:hypothetical protein
MVRDRWLDNFSAYDCLVFPAPLIEETVLSQMIVLAVFGEI